MAKGVAKQMMIFVYRLVFQLSSWVAYLCACPTLHQADTSIQASEGNLGTWSVAEKLCPTEPTIQWQVARVCHKKSIIHAQYKGNVEGQEHDARCKEAQTIGSRQETTSQMRCATYKMQQQTNDLQYGAIYD